MNGYALDATRRRRRRGKKLDNKYFSSARDRDVEAADGFWCRSCLISKEIGEQSQDQRYCSGCFEFLLNEAALLTSGKRPEWVPVGAGEPSSRAEALSTLEEVDAKLPINGILPVAVMQHAGGRPRKEGRVHRTTTWRRQKQGMLV